jgi:ABC-2 type transport system ATP-binding protein
MIRTENLVKSYTGEVVLDLPNLIIPSGEVFGLVGNNGAGKTTFFSLVLDLIKATRGIVFNNEINVGKSEAWKDFTSAFIDESFTIGYLTPEEFFGFTGELRNMNKADMEKFLSHFDDFFNGEIIGRKKYIRDLSKGNQKKVGIVAAMIGNPQVIILDEPFANLDPSSQYKLRKIIKDYAVANNTTFLISSHDLDNISDVCQRIVILEKGKIVKDVKKSESTLKDLEDYFSGIREEKSFLDT